MTLIQQRKQVTRQFLYPATILFKVNPLQYWRRGF